MDPATHRSRAEYHVKAPTPRDTWSSVCARTCSGLGTRDRSDNEAALDQVVERAIAALNIQGVEHLVEERSVPYDPLTNGAAESAVRLFKGMFKALLLG